MKNALTTSAAVTSVLPFAQADISYFTVDIAPIETNELLYFDLSENVHAADDFTNADFTVYFDYVNSEKPTFSSSYPGLNYAFAVNGGSTLTRYTYGQELNINTSLDSTRHMAALDKPDTGGEWADDVGGETAYVGFLNAGTSKGWIEVDYDDANNTIDILSYAIGDSSDNMMAGVVPEPAETAALMLLAAGSAALYSRRKRK